jgi:hydrogenase-4 component B
MMFVAIAIAVMVAGYTGGALAAILAPSLRAVRRGTSIGAAVGSAGSIAAAAGIMASARAADWALPGVAAPAGGLVFHLDPLGAFFLAIVGIGGLPAAIYGEAYTAPYEARWPLRFFGVAFNVFLLAMSLVPCAGNIFTFVMAWELMSLSSYFLVMTDAAEAETRQAGLWYIAMTQFSLVMVLPALLLLAPGAERTTFADLRAGAAAAPSAVRTLAFLLAAAGFGSKAGIVPLHVWLPRAHPAAPSHVSSLMSGVMIKLGIYGLVRIVFDLLGGGPAWWGALLLIVGSLSAVLGVLYALMEHDLKRLLAYHSVENIGIIVIGLGAGAMLHSYGLHALALVGVAAALYHTLNHACFKGLLFLAAGSAVHEAHTRNMEEMGGLIKRMPQTAALFFIGAAAISALPPLNGFASEWLVFQALLAGATIPRPEVAIGFPVAVGMLALASGLAAACFVKAFGISFLAMPRSTHAAEAREAPASMRVAGWLLAGMCVVLGIGAPLVLPVLYGVLASITALAPGPVAAPASGWWIGAGTTLGWLSPPLLAILALVVVTATIVGIRAVHRRPIRYAETWGCGRIAHTPRMEYTASAFAEPLRRVFAELYRPTQDLTVNVHPDSKYFVDSITFRSEVHPWFEQVIYDPVVRACRAAGAAVRQLQAGSVHLYIVYVAVALVIALAAVWWGP